MSQQPDKAPASTGTHEKKKPETKRYPNETDAATLGEHGEMGKTVRREFLTAFVVSFKGNPEDAWDAAEGALLVGQVRGHLP